MSTAKEVFIDACDEFTYQQKDPGGDLQKSSSEETSESYLSSDSKSGESSSSSVISWIHWFCTLPGHEYFTEIPEDFIEDDFNLTGLSLIIPLYNEALDTTLDLELEEIPNHTRTRQELAAIEESAEKLYGMIHQRYILTKQGLAAMAAKFENGDFGTCPRILCGGSRVVPVGQYDQMDFEAVKLFCPRCVDIYNPKETRHNNVDGAFFGTTFAHLFFLSYPQLIPPLQAVPNPNFKKKSTSSSDTSLDDEEDDESEVEFDLEDYQIYVARIFGFRVNERSVAGPRMTWLRWRRGMPLSTFFGSLKP